MIATNAIDSLPKTARIWIYVSNRAFNEFEINSLNAEIELFTENWVSHQNQLYAAGAIYYDRVLVLAVDESKAGASGCSLDKSVQFVKNLGEQFNADFFDRFIFGYYNENEELIFTNRNEFEKAYRNNEINDKTLVMNSLVNNLFDFENNLFIPLATSWHKRLI